jgi:hypothetical protein
MKDPREAKIFSPSFREFSAHGSVPMGICAPDGQQSHSYGRIFYLDLVAREAEIVFSLSRAHWGWPIDSMIIPLLVN